MPIRTALDIFHVLDEQALKASWEADLAGLGLTRHKVDKVVQAYVSDNRWVADCPECNSGMGILPDLAITVCIGCGGEYDVAMPPNRNVAEMALLARMPERRHWMPHRGETVEDLARDNLKYMEAN